MIETFFKGVLYDIFELLNGIMVCFSTNLSWEVALSTYWFLFIIEFPRYYLLDIITAIRQVFFHKSFRRRDTVARNLLYTEMPLVSILAPGKNEGRHIYKLVESLREQTYQNFEIIIVDDGSDDATPIICNDLQRAGYITKFSASISAEERHAPQTSPRHTPQANTSFTLTLTARSTAMQ